MIKTILGSPAGSFAFVGGLLVLAFWLYGRFVKLSAENCELFRKCGDLGDGMNNLRKDISVLIGEMQFVKNTLNSITNEIQRNAKADATMQAHSPLALTDFGRKIAHDMGAEKAIASNWEHIRSILDAEMQSKNPYDIQTYCLEKIPVAPERFFDKESLDGFKTYAFNNGRTLFECMKVVGLIVRDDYFKTLENH